MNKRKNSKIVIISLFLIISIFSVFLMTKSSFDVVTNTTSTDSVEFFKSVEELTSNGEKYVYLSDLSYITTNNWSYVGWGSLNMDAPPEGSVIQLRVNGEVKKYLKGIGMHAKSQVTYDVSAISNKYTRFVSKAGVDASRGNLGNIWFSVSASKDGEKWDELYKSKAITSASEALEIDVNIKGYKYLRVYADTNGVADSDHAVLGDAMIITADYEPVELAPYDKLHNLNYYDNILSKNNVEYNYNNNYRLVLERELVRKIGYETIMGYANLNDRYRSAIDWLLASNERIEQIIEVGEISNTAKFITILTDLYNKYPTEFVGSKSLIYTKMAVGLAATYTTDAVLSPLRFGGYAANYDYIERFTLMKQLFDNDKFLVFPGGANNGQTMVKNTFFENFHVELIRMIMHEGIRNDELVWLNEYTHYKKNYSEHQVPYLSPNYAQAKLYAEENRATYNQKYLLAQYGVPYNDGIQRYWMVFEAGGICWDQSRIGQSMWRVNGIPAVGAYQPGHEMFFTYFQDNNGNGYWLERYGNYSSAGTTWGGGQRTRLIFNWGGKYFADQNISGSKGGTSLGYLYLGQANLNNYSKYKKSVYYNLIANSYDNNKKVETYKKSLEVNDINLDTYDNLITLYKSMNGNGINSHDWYELAHQITDSYENFPVAMYDLLKVIRPYLEGAEKLDIDRLEKEKLTAAVNVSDATLASIGAVGAGSGVRAHARYLLGLAQPDPMSFSFDGANANKIVKNPIYQFNWAYSLDGGRTFSEYSEADSVTLTEREILTMSVDNDIIVRFEGLNDYRFRIDITQGTIYSDLYGSDLENRLVGTTRALEWRTNSLDKWKKLEDSVPDLTGNKSIDVRVGYTKTYLPSSYVTYTFTEDNQPNTRKYISIDHLSVQSVSSEATNNNGAAKFALDANYNSRWHSNWNGNDTSRYFTIKLDEARYISAVEFVPAGGGNGKIYDGVIYGSVDGKEWVELTRKTNLTYTNACDTVDQAKANIKSFDIEDPQKVQYIKIHAVRTNGNWFTARAFNLYEDLTVKQAATFSFDGSNAGKIVLVDDFKGREWSYSIDGGKTYKNVKEDSHKLTDNELDSINENNGIRVKINGDKTEYKINIKKGTTPSINPYLNDLENRLFEMTNTASLEWKIGNGKWTSYSEKEPVVEGNNKLYIRTKATRNITASDSLEYQFSENNTDKYTYIPIKHLSVSDYSSQTVRTGNNEPATNAIDGRQSTMWHTFRGATAAEAFADKKYIVIKLDEEKYISKIEYNKQVNYVYGVPKNGIISVSMDGENFEEVYRFENLYNPSNKNELMAMPNKKDIVLPESKLALYVKIQVTTSCDYVNGSTNGVPNNFFFAATMLNLFEDTTKALPNELIEYNINTKTNKDVVATIVTNDNITVTNNGGKKSHTFTENGNFTFEYTTSKGQKKTITAVVDWIDKVAPVGTITYSTRDITNQNVIVTLSTNEKTTITNNGGKNTYTFTDKGEFTFEFVDEAGNKGSATAVVDWIFKGAPTARINYSSTELTNKDVQAILEVADGVTVTNNGGKKTYTFTKNGSFKFEFMDRAGNVGSATATVNNIDKTAPTAKVSYSITTPTNKDVVVSLVNESEDIVITNNNGNRTHTFTENGEFTFEFVDRAGNTGSVKAKVNNIDRTAPTAKVSYSTTNLTNKDVVATLTDVSEEVTITNNNGKNTYTFTKNDEFTFEFVDKAGNKGTVKASVNNIDKTAPTAKVSYSTTNPTNKDVVATLTDISEEVTITNNNGKDTYTFTKNGNFTFEFVDKAGNKGSVKASVNNIDKDAPIGTITYNKTTYTNDAVIATLTTNEEVTITNNDGKDIHVFKENGEFTFEFVDSVGNKGTAMAKVTWINKEAPIGTITYNINDLTNKDVVATLKVKDGVKVTNNNGSKTHTFTKNGEFIFEFVDSIGNKGSAKASVNWIDKDKPIGTITYNIHELTNKDVIATIKFNEEVNIESTTHTFDKNGEFTFEFTDKAGNKNTAKASVNWIDKDKPIGTITYNTRELTNKDVIATIKFNEEVIIESTSHTFDKNGEFTFEFTDKAGNKNTALAKVDWIDKDVPVATISYDINTLTKEDVVATIKFNEDDVVITNNDGKNTYTFKYNHEFKFEFVDKAGNKGSAIAKVDWIDKVVPTGTISYDIKELTNKNVTATLKVKDGVKVINNNGSETFTFTDNGVFTFEFEDKLGNRGSATAKVDWIDKKAPVGEVTYNINKLTNKNVTATIKFNEDDVVITNNGGKDTYTFTENGEFIFEFTDKAGNKSTYTAKVNWIDKVVAKGTISYDTRELTNSNVVATVTFDKEDVVIINNNSSNTYTFDKNGEFVFEYIDKAGNTGTIKAIVNWIDKVIPECEVEYNISKLTNQDVVATIKFNDDDITITNNNGKNTYTFAENGSFTFEFVDKAGNKGSYTVKVDWIDKVVATARVIYSTMNETTDSVIATITSDEEIFVINNNGLKTYTFKENGEFEFAYEDKLGNKGNILAKVDWIKKNNIPSIPEPSKNPSKPSEQPVSKPVISNNTNTSSNNNNYNSSNNQTDSNNNSNKDDSIGLIDSKEEDNSKDDDSDQEDNNLELRKYFEDDSEKSYLFETIIGILILACLGLSIIYKITVKKYNSK